MRTDIISFLLTCVSKVLKDSGKSEAKFVSPQMFSVDQLPNLFVSIKDIAMELKDPSILNYYMLAVIDNVNRYPVSVMDVMQTRSSIVININGRSNTIHTNMLGSISPQAVRDIVDRAINDIPELLSYLERNAQ